MTLYRKAAPLRLRRAGAPEPPFWCATSLAPYGARRGSPIAIDYLAARASGGERGEVTVCENVRDELERARAIDAPVLIDAAEPAEAVFRRGEEALAFCAENELAAMVLTSTRATLPLRVPDVVTIAAWPLDLARLEQLFAQVEDRHSCLSPAPPEDERTGRIACPPLSWGVAIPILYPITTELASLGALAKSARAHGASFFAALPMEVEATAKQAIAHELELAGSDDRYAMLFHSDVAPIHLATERHIAAVAHEHEMRDFIVPPRFEAKTNWNAAALLTRTASRMIAMELDLDLAGLIARSARAVAELDKPVARVAEAASLSIIGALDEHSSEILTEWMSSGTASFVEYVDEQWRLSRYVT